MDFRAGAGEPSSCSIAAILCQLQADTRALLNSIRKLNRCRSFSALFSIQDSSSFTLALYFQLTNDSWLREGLSGVKLEVSACVGVVRGILELGTWMGQLWGEYNSWNRVLVFGGGFVFNNKTPIHGSW